VEEVYTYLKGDFLLPFPRCGIRFAVQTSVHHSTLKYVPALGRRRRRRRSLPPVMSPYNEADRDRKALSSLVRSTDGEIFFGSAGEGEEKSGANWCFGRLKFPHKRAEGRIADE